ncbi:MAG: HD domain-containing protein [Anaerostipes sp.]|nr:HD domain-containing protein [Anaerostipes sp.]MDD3745166.1 HD domain-containing protein [Anaerostipes sp.]
MDKQLSRLEQQLQFIVEIDKVKKITRQTYLADLSRKENDAEHSWHMALMAFILKEYANEEVDVLHVIEMLLIHDLVEIDAGDTYLYDEEARKEAAIREEKAAQRIFQMLPKEQEKYVYDLWREFEDRETPESKFANTLDRVQPILLNDAGDGLAWREHEVNIDQVMTMNHRTKDGSNVLWNHLLEIFEKHMNQGNIKRS